ncbi:MAG: serine protease inhibitor [Firmicutes bacterium]|nr:serine protease inhibitor [Bacillota bacterium]
MKKKICLFLSVIFAAASMSGCGKSAEHYDAGKISSAFVDSNNGFAFDVFRELNSGAGEGNIFISPLSISTALSMVYEGAGGETREAMARALNYEEIEPAVLNDGYKNLLLHLNSQDSKVKLGIKNSIWIRQGEAIKEDFINTNEDVFDAYISEIDFSQSDAADRINKWISEATEGKIEKMVASPIDPMVVMYLINAIYFKGEWTTRFEEKNTFEAKFNSADGSQGDIMMMSMQSDMKYALEEGYRAIKLPYGSKNIAMYCILPEGGATVDEIIGNMDSKKWDEIKGRTAMTEAVNIQIPRFKIDYGIKELNESLTAIGMGICFTEEADLTGIRDNILISSVLHKAVIEVNEKGTEAAAVTVVEIKETAYSEQPEFIADRPFVFIIEDSETGSILFMGKYSKV